MFSLIVFSFNLHFLVRFSFSSSLSDFMFICHLIPFSHSVFILKYIFRFLAHYLLSRSYSIFLFFPFSHSLSNFPSHSFFSFIFPLIFLSLSISPFLFPFYNLFFPFSPSFTINPLDFPLIPLISRNVPFTPCVTSSLCATHSLLMHIADNGVEFSHQSVVQRPDSLAFSTIMRA